MMDIRERHPATQHLLALFSYDHLPEGPLREQSKAVCDLAVAVVALTPEDGQELTAGLRKLLEAKDCFVRAKLSGDQVYRNLEAINRHIAELTAPE